MTEEGHPLAASIASVLGHLILTASASIQPNVPAHSTQTSPADAGLFRL